MPAAPSLLLVEDNEGHSYLVQEKFCLAFPDAEIACAGTLKEAMELLPSKPWDLIIINSKLPDGSATDLLDHLSACQPFAAVGVLTEESGDVEIELAGHQGPVELLTKDRSTLDSFVGRVKRLMAASRQMNDLLQGKIEAGDTLFRDSLTGVYNRSYFNDALRREVWRANRHRQDIALLLVDADYPKPMRNGTKRIQLKKLASILSHSIRSGDIVARYENDQFVMLLHQCQRSHAIRCANRVLANVRRTDTTPPFSVSIGIMHYRGSSKVIRPQQILSQAKRALAYAKSQGGSRFHIAA